MTRRNTTSLATGVGASAPTFGSARNRALAPEETPLTAKRAALLAAIILFAILPLWAAQVAYSPRAKQIGMHLKCMCRGCDMSAGGCAHPGGSFSGPCDTAKGELREVDDLLAQGKTEQQIIDAFVAKYGTIVYVEPPKTGFGLVAWIMPVLYAFVGLALAFFVVYKWTRRSAASVPAEASVPNAALERVRAQADRETED